MIRREDGTERMPPFVQIAGIWYVIVGWQQRYEDVCPGGPNSLLLRPLGRDEEHLLRERIHDALVEAHTFVARDTYERDD